ncbi:MAG TPA: septum formation initiator family protein [Caulobacteraceae bacterium]|nr:septum formation initiator family protein [Caulobacteraceae bacterium]
MLARLSTFIPTVVLAALIVYFGFNALTGDRGILTTRQRQATLAEDEAQLQTLRAEHAELALHARLLSDQTPSSDLIEERAHEVLGFADPKDYVIRTPEAAR